MTASFSGVLIRKCRGLDEVDACVRLETEVWGYADGDVIPGRTFVVAEKIGGQVIGAFDVSMANANPDGDAGSLIGFAMALPGFGRTAHAPAPGLPYLHSHMLAVQLKYRNRGIGRQMKLFQREDALSQGITLMEWTFDPLEIKNSFLNIARLGAIVRRYTPNLYGVSSSRLQGTLPTDRLHAEWWMESQRVKCAVDNEPVPLPPIERRIVIPHDIYRWKQTSGECKRALELQLNNRRQFERAFADGLAVVAFRIDPEGSGIFELGRCEELEEPLPERLRNQRTTTQGATTEPRRYS